MTTKLLHIKSSVVMKVLKALQDAVTNHNLAVQPNPPPPEPTPTNATSVKNHARQLPVHSFQVNWVERSILSYKILAKVFK